MDDENITNSTETSSESTIPTISYINCKGTKYMISDPLGIKINGNISELTNDAGFITVDNLLYELLSYVAISGDYSDLNDAPSKVSDLTNDAGYITMDDLSDIFKTISAALNDLNSRLEVLETAAETNASDSSSETDTTVESSQ